MNLTTRTKLDLGFAGALVALLVLGVMSLWSLARFRHDQRELQRTGEILRTREAALFALSQAETSQRGYLLTGQEVFLRPYHPSSEAVQAHLRTLATLVRDPLPRRRLAAFREAVTRKLAIMDRTVALARGGDTAGAVAVVRRGTGRELNLLILDLGLPDADGFAVVEWLQRDLLLSKAPVLVYTARDLDAADRDRLRLGPTEFLTKSRDALEDVEERALSMLGNLIPRSSASAETNPDRG